MKIAELEKNLDIKFAVQMIKALTAFDVISEAL